jgi:hypothetical protein
MKWAGALVIAVLLLGEKPVHAQADPLLRPGNSGDVSQLAREVGAGAVVVGEGPIVQPAGAGIILSRNSGKYRATSKGSEDGWLAEITNNSDRRVRVVLFTAINAGPASGISNVRLRIGGAPAAGVRFTTPLAQDACQTVERLRPHGCFSPGYDYIFYVIGDVQPKAKKTIDVSLESTSRALFAPLPRKP